MNSSHHINLEYLPNSNVWYFPTFNLADSAITIGAIIVAADAFFHRQHTAAADSAEPPAEQK